MKWRLVGAASLVGAFGVAPAEARVQFDVGARLGYAIPSGEAAKPEALNEATGSKLSDSAAGQIPLALELNVRVVPMLALGGYAELAPAILSSRLSDRCDALNDDCFLMGVHFGLIAHFHALPHRPVDPWFGVGIGLEGLTLNRELSTGQKIKEGLAGYEIPLRAGVDFKLSEKFYLGPFFGYTPGKYVGLSFQCEGAGCSDDDSSSIPHKAWHGWFNFGAKLTVLAF